MTIAVRLGVVDHAHVLLSELEPDGSPKIKELVPAQQVDERLWRVSATPGLLNGCAQDDLVEVAADGSFKVVERGGNIAAHVYARQAISEADLEELRREFRTVGGQVEWPSNRRFVVVTLDVKAGFSVVERLLDEFVRTHGDTEWFFGNVYDSDGLPLNWWQ